MCESLETSNILSVVLVFDTVSFSLGTSFNLQSSGLFLWTSTLSQHFSDALISFDLAEVGLGHARYINVM